MIRELYKYIFRNVVGMIGISVYVLADTIFISKAGGTDGITVLNLALPLYGLIFAIGSMIGVGSATKYGLDKAKGNEAKNYFVNSLFWQLIIAVPFIIVGILDPKLWLIIMGGDINIASLGQDYIRIVLLGTPFFVTNYTFTAFARNDNATKTAMIATLLSSGFNIVFDYIFMFPMKMGIVGAALATAMAPLVSICICLTHFLSPKSGINFNLIKPSFLKMIDACKYGISAFVSEMSSAVITTVFNFLLLDITGNIGVAAYGVVANLAIVAVAIFNGIAQGMQPLISRCFGRREYKDLKILLKNGIILTVILEGIVLAQAWFMTSSLVAMFNSEGNALLEVYASDAVRLYSLGFIFAGINIVIVTFFASIGEALCATVSSILRGAVAIIGFSIVLSQYLGMNGVWISFVASEGLTFIVVMGLFFKMVSKKIRREN